MIKNYTPHTVTICLDDGPNLVLESKGVARCMSGEQMIGSIEGVPVYRIAFGSVFGLPEKEEGVVYIVSRIVAEALSGIRDDVYVVSGTFRDDEGNIIGCRGLAKI